jgi:hypothetical protein
MVKSAAREEHVLMVKTLLEHSACIDAQNKLGINSLMLTT